MWGTKIGLCGILYNSLLSAFTLVLTNEQAAQRMSEKRQQILEALGDVPRTIAKVESYLNIFPSDETLNDLIIELYCVILGAIEGMMQWLVDRPGCEYSVQYVIFV